MKIVKIIEDESHAHSVKKKFLFIDSTNIQWSWGLGDDGQLYCRCPFFASHKDWILWEHASLTSNISLGSMKKIIDSFGHLLVFI